jgi:hypothetical protein
MNQIEQTPQAQLIRFVVDQLVSEPIYSITELSIADIPGKSSENIDNLYHHCEEAHIIFILRPGANGFTVKQVGRISQKPDLLSFDKKCGIEIIKLNPQHYSAG